MLCRKKIKTRAHGGEILLYIYAFLGHISKKSNTIHFLVHGHSSWSTFGLHLVGGGGKGSVHCFIKEKEYRPWKLDHQVRLWKRPSSMVQLHGVNKP